MYTVATMHAIFVVHCWVNMKPLNRTQPTNFQLCSNHWTNHNSWFGVKGPSKMLLPQVPVLVDRSLPSTVTACLLSPKLSVHFVLFKIFIPQHWGFYTSITASNFSIFLFPLRSLLYYLGLIFPVHKRLYSFRVLSYLFV